MSDSNNIFRRVLFHEDKLESAIVIPVFNRCRTTVHCLQTLQAEGVHRWAKIIVVDSGSTDGTPEQIREHFPYCALFGLDNSNWWAGAIKHGMENIPKTVTTMFWLNDDCRPRPDVLKRMHDFVKREGAILSAIAVTPEGVRYGGFRKSWQGLVRVEPLGDSLHPIDTFNGNCVGMPRIVLDRVGLVDATCMMHNGADTDYGLRATRAGIRAFVSGWACCDNDTNPAEILQSWSDGTLPFRDLRKGMRNPKSFMYWPDRSQFYRRHWGRVWGTFLAAFPYFRFYFMWAISAIFGRKTLSRLKHLRDSARSSLPLSGAGRAF